MSPWLPRLGRSLRRSLRWSVVVSSPRGEAGEQWGDTWFGRDLVTALQERGQQARLVHPAGATSAERDQDDVVLVLRGLKPVIPRATTSRTKWLLWVISHPDEVNAAEIEPYDAVFAASANWPRAQSFPKPVLPLLQATNPSRFRPDAAPPDSGAAVLFVGSTRGQFRPVVRDALACGADLSLFGVGWQDLIASQHQRHHLGEFLPNPQLSAAYAGAGVVLNDHWPDMAEQGFLSNRLFDALACGARVVSDDAAGLHEVFGSAVRTYRSVDELRPLVTGDFPAQFPDRHERLECAARIADEHSFLVRADTLIDVAREL